MAVEYNSNNNNNNNNINNNNNKTTTTTAITLLPTTTTSTTLTTGHYSQATVAWSMEGEPDIHLPIYFFPQDFTPESLTCDLAVLCAQLGSGALSGHGVQRPRECSNSKTKEETSSK